MSLTKEKFMCPKCKKKTLSYFNTSEGVVLDFCDECSGIWFDKNELQEAIKISGLDKNNKILTLLKDMFKK